MIIAACLLLFAGQAYAQDIPEQEVPSLVLNSFKQKFPKASGTEWEIKGDGYKAEFDAGSSAEHEVWFDNTGNVIKHRHDISARDLPQAVLGTLQKDFNGYRTDEVKKTEEGSSVTYTLELKSRGPDWKVVIDKDGKVLEKRAD